MPESWLSDRRGRSERWRPSNDIAVSYSRFSATGQKEISVERQIEACEDYVASTGRTMRCNYADRAKSGTGMVGRTALHDLLDAASRGEFGILVIENVDRLARNLSILATVYKKLQALGIEMHQPGRGKLNLTDIAVQGMMGDEGRRIMMERMQFSRDRMARDGLWPSGMAYGYDKVPGRPGHRIVNERQAEVIRHIYELRLEGLNGRQIAFVLNAQGTSGREWTESAVLEVLRNPRYNGVQVYKQTEVTRDPDTERTKISLRPREEWIVADVPHLRIVDADTWDRVQAMAAARRKVDAIKPGHPHEYLLSRKVKCQVCGKNMGVASAPGGPRFVCSSFRSKRVCKSKVSFRIVPLERLVVSLIGEHLLRPGCTEAYVDAYNAEVQRVEKDNDVARAELQRRVRDASRRLDATFDDALMLGFTPDRMAGLRGKLDAEMRRAEADLANLPRRPAVIGLDQRRMTHLRDSLEIMRRSAPIRPVDEESLRLMAAFGELVERVDVVVLGRGMFDASVKLKLGSLTSGVNKQLKGIVLKGSYRWKGKAYSVSERRDADVEHLAAGRYALTDEEWNAVSGYIPPRALKTLDGSKVHGKTVVEALVFQVMAKVPWSGVPMLFGDTKTINAAARKLVYHGVWDKIIAELNRRDPERYAVLLSAKFGRSAKSLRSYGKKAYR